MKLALGILFVLLAPLVLIQVMDRSGSDFQHFDGLSRSELLPVGLGFAMLIGIFFGALYQGLTDRNEAISIKEEVRQTMRKPHLWRALLAAPIVFVGVYAAAREYADALVAVVFAFQNGFFCESILRKGQKGP